MKRLLNFTFTALILAMAGLANAGERVGDFALIDHLGGFHQMSWYDDNSAIVILSVAIGTELPKESLTTLTELQTKYGEQGVVFFGMNPGLQTDRELVKADIAETGLNLPVLMDDAQLVSELLGLTRIGEAVIYDPKNFDLLYRGAIRADMDRILEQALNGEELNLVSTSSLGQAIDYARSTQTSAVSYVNDVAPIVAENCASCHRDGGIAPFAMDSHLTLQGWSPMIKEVVMTKRMPPGQVDNKVGHAIADAMNLTDEEMQKLVHWIDEGSVIDTADDPLAALIWPESKWERGEPDFIVAVPPQSIPATGIVEYLDVVVDLGLDRDVWVKGSQIIAGEPSTLHHVLTGVIPPEGRKSQQEIFMQIVNSLPPEKARPIQQQLMAAVTSGAGINFNQLLNSLPPEADISALFSGSQDADSASIAGYASGAKGLWNDPGVGGLLRAGSSLELQLHYTTVGRELTDASEIGIWLYPDGEIPTQRMSGAIANNFNIDIPAGAKDHEMVTEVTVHEDAYLESFLPHMHFRGKRMRFNAIYPDGSEELLLSVPNYSFNWQLNHRLEEPLFVPAGTKIQAIGAFDNSRQNEYNPDPDSEIFWGEQSWQEMFMGFYTWKNVDQSGSE
ncbi:MAG: mono/diheme cytochrome c family protein [Glaciecola sp.]|jgi:mono/diheme cytochrome c family protein